MQKSKSAKFTIRLDSELLHELLQRIATAAYERGYADHEAGREREEKRVAINPDDLRRFM